MGSVHRVEKVNCAFFALLAILLVTHSVGLTDAKRTYGNNRKSSSGGSSRTSPSSNTHVTKPTYSSSSGNSHADVAKLSYPNYNSQPNRPPAAGGASPGGASPGGAQPIGWNVPHNQGPPPAYSPTNTGGRTNMHEAPPAYSPGNVHSPITATNTHGLQSSYPGAPGSMPAGGAYYPSAGHLPAGATYHAPGSIPAGATYYPSGGQFPAGGGYHAPGAVPAGATYYPSSGQLPPGAVYYSQPPQSSSGLGFGSGLAAGAIGGALLGHALTPTQTRVVEAAPANGGSSGGEDKIIIINNGPPGSVTTSQAGSGTTVITTGGAAAAADLMNTTAPAAAPDSGIPNVPLAPLGDTNTPAAVQPAAPAAAPPADQPPAGGIICMPVRLNETDPNDSSKMIEVEKVACYPAPPAPPAANEQQTPPADGSAPLAAMSNAAPEQASQQMHQTPTQATLLPEQSSIRTSGAGDLYPYMGLLVSSLFYCLLSA